MSWKADQIYTKPNADLIKYLQQIDGFSEELFLVNDLEGIRNDFFRDFMLKDLQNEYSHQKHSLPDDGILVIKPNIGKTLLDTEDKFWDKYAQIYPEKKWNFINKETSKELNINIPASQNQLKLFYFLNELSLKFNTPIVYYYCHMWAGEIEEEFSIVFDKEVKVYQYDQELEMDFQIIGLEKVEIESTILQTVLQNIDLHLPTWFFILHAGLFDWKRYHINKANSN